MYAIWNLTKVCPWDCSFCCMSAIKVGQVNGGESLNFSEKIKVLEILATHKMKIDFSGGDPLYNSITQKISLLWKELSKLCLEILLILA